MYSTHFRPAQHPSQNGGHLSMRLNSEMGGLLSMCRNSEMGSVVLASKKSSCLVLFFGDATNLNIIKGETAVVCKPGRARTHII